MRRHRLLPLFLLCLSMLMSSFGVAAAPRGLPCPRYPAGSSLVEPKDLFSSHGVLRVDFLYQQRVDDQGNQLFCFSMPDGTQSPTLHVKPGDELILHLRNDLPPAPVMSMAPAAVGAMDTMPGMTSNVASPARAGDCSGMVMTGSSTNLHFHGTNVPASCHQDEVIKTLVNSGESFDYDVHIPVDEPPGLYWYHPHVHGSSEAALQGGASGAIVVDGLQNIVPEVAGLPQRILIFRDNLMPGAQDGDGDSDGGADTPAWDLSLNYIPVAFPRYKPAVIPLRPRQHQLWRVLNASADTILDLQLRFDGIAQPLRVVALDGVPVNSQDGLTGGRPFSRDHILIPPAGRAEFIIPSPSPRIRLAQLVTRNIDTGPDGDVDPDRPLANLHVSATASTPPSVPEVDAPPPARARFADLRRETPVVHRKLFFSEVLSVPNDPNSPTNFYITVDGQTPVLFSPDNPPAIITTEGAVEDWTVENRALENHEFHMHQIHFFVLAQDGVPVKDGQFLDTVNIPYWSGSGPYPSVTLRMDFRGVAPGDFVYHCHILGHEDAGMMAIIRVLPRR